MLVVLHLLGHEHGALAWRVWRTAIVPAFPVAPSTRMLWPAAGQAMSPADGLAQLSFLVHGILEAGHRSMIFL